MKVLFYFYPCRNKIHEMILSYIDWNVKPQIFQLENFELRWYSLLFALGFLVGYYIMAWMFKKEKISIELLDKLTVYIIVATIFGARFGHCIFYEPEVYLKDPLRMILPWQGMPFTDNFKFTGYQGLASHGGAIGILIALALFSRKFKLPYLWILDRIAIVTAFAGGCIRTGNLFNSEIYGVQTDLPWGFRFLREALYGTPIDQIVPKHPTQLYEAFAYFAIFALLMFFYYKGHEKYHHGFFVGIFLSLVFTARFFIEFIKEDQVSFETGMQLNMGQWLSIPFVIAGALLFYFSLKKKPA